MKSLYSVLVLFVVLVVAFVLFRKNAIAPSDGAPSTVSVKVYFSNSKLDPQFTCVQTFPVVRTVSKATEPTLGALKELLAGPTGTEMAEEYQTSIPPYVKINSLGIENGIAYADFDRALEQGVAGSCRVSAIRSQITNTLLQFSTVKNVVISADGRTKDILQP